MNIADEIKRLGEIAPWYHAFELQAGLSISGWEGVRPIWDNIRAVRAGIPYGGARVLDIGSRDGMWAFEAEAQGASVVVATDIACRGYLEHAAFIKSQLSSRVGLYYNVPVEDLFGRLDCFFVENPGLFDVVQHLGVFYHLEDPIRSLRQVRKCLKTGGTLLFETAAFLSDDQRPVALFNSRSNVYTDPTTFWAFNQAALDGAMLLAGFRINQPTIRVLPQSPSIHRVCFTATAL